MRPFGKFFLLALAFFLFLFFAKFLVMAFIAAVALTFISSVVRKIRQASYYGDYLTPHDRRWLPVDSSMFPRQDPGLEPLVEMDDLKDGWYLKHRSIRVG